MAKAAEHSKPGGSVVVDLLFNVLPIVYGSSFFVFVYYALLCVYSSFAIILKRGKAGCFPIIVLQMSCYCQFSVALPNSVMGWLAVCDCGIS